MSASSSAFLKSLGIVFILLAFLLGYEALHWQLGWNNAWKRPHFFSPYDSSSTETENPSFEVEDLEKVLQEWDSVSTSFPSLFSPNDSNAAFDTLSALPEKPSSPMPDAYTGKEHLEPFFKALRDLAQGHRKRVRIAYFGDSTTEGDITVAELRDALQRQLGGKGVGFVPIKSHSMKGRRSLIQDASGLWIWKKYFRSEGQITEYFGISGDYFLPTYRQGDSLSAKHFVYFKAPKGNRYPQCDTLTNIYLFFASSLDSNQSQAHAILQVSHGDSSHTEFSLRPKIGLNKLLVSQRISTEVKFDFRFHGRFPLYGFSLEDEQGIYVDNLAKRSDSGSHFHKIPGGLLQAFQAHFQYDLVVLHFGPNVLSDKVLQYGHYRELLARNIQHFQKYWPNVPILIIGHPDRAYKDEQGLRSHPALPGLIAAQRQAAYESQNAFFDLAQAMGGRGSMIQWVERGLASPDYIHFSHSGGGLVAKYLLEYWNFPQVLQGNSFLQMPANKPDTHKLMKK